MTSKRSTDIDDETHHIEAVGSRYSVPETDSSSEDWRQLRKDATLATEDEHNTTFAQAVRRFPKAAFWSAVVSLCIIMDGYDTALLGSLYAFPAFGKKFGHKVPGKGYNIDAQWQVALGMGANVGNILGITLNGYLTDRFGHRVVLQGGLLFLTGFIFISFFAQNVQTLLVGQLLCGIPWGIFTTMAPAFASEVAPLVLRSYLETWVVVCWGIGQFLSYAVLFTLNEWDSEWAFRIPFAIQWVWPVIIGPLIAFCPESPWWLVRKKRYHQAECSITRLTTSATKAEAKESAKRTLALMIETDRLEQDMEKDTSYAACFTGTDLRRTEIAAVAWGSQILTGFVIQGWATYFFRQAGLSVPDSFKMTLGIGGIHLICNAGSAALTGNYGRRRLYMIGCSLLATLMFIIGGLAFGPATSAFGFATSAVYLVWFGVWCLSLGPLPYIINGEVSSTRLRSKTIAIARGTYVVLNIVNSVAGPYILNPTRGNWRGKAGLLTGGLTVLTLVWAYFRLPETRGRTYEELDVLFAEKNLPARDFAKAVINREGDKFTVSRPGPAAVLG